MADSSNTQDPPPGNNDNAPNQQPLQREYTVKKITMVQAAMLEELGPGRRELLPLADRGPDPALMVARLPAKKDMQAATAGWRSK